MSNNGPYTVGKTTNYGISSQSAPSNTELRQPIQASIENLEKGLANLKDSVERLEDRLAPIRLPQVSQIGVDEPGESESFSLLNKRLIDLSRSLSIQIDRIEAIITSLDL